MIDFLATLYPGHFTSYASAKVIELGPLICIILDHVGAPGPVLFASVE